MNRNLFPWGSFFGGAFSHEMVAWPLLVGILYSVYLQWKGESVFVYNKWIIAFICGAFLIELISIVHGSYIFPYWDLIDNSFIPEKSRVRAIILLLQEHGWFQDEEVNLHLFLGYTFIKDSLLNVLVPYGGMYMIYCWYQDDYKRAISVMEKAVMVSTLLLFGYCVIELFALWGEPFSQDVLFKLDMLLHYPEADEVDYVERWLKNWTLYAKQLRGYFTEPSFLGMYANVMASFLWYRILKDSSKWAIVCNLILGVIVVLTSSRAAVGIYCSMLILLIVVMLYKRDRRLFLKGSVIVVSSVLAFSFGLFSIKNIIVDSNKKVVDSNKYATYIKADAEGYFESNVGSITNVKARSNPARYTYAYCALKTGMEYPILGVGHKFYSAYAPNYIPEWGKSNSEVKRYLKKTREKGILAESFPVLNEYLHIFATKGIIGLVWDMLAFLFISWMTLKILKKSIEEKIPECVLFLELLLGIALWGMNIALGLFYSSWVVFAIVVLAIEKEIKRKIEINAY